MHSEQFWIHDPCALIEEFTFLPKKEQNLNGKLNAITRLIIAISLLFYFLGSKFWLIFALVMLVLVLVFKIYKSRVKENYVRGGFPQEDYLSLFENEEITPSHELVEILDEKPIRVPFHTNLLPSDEIKPLNPKDPSIFFKHDQEFRDRISNTIQRNMDKKFGTRSRRGFYSF